MKKILDGNQIASMIDSDRIISRNRMVQITMSNEDILTMLEHAIDYLCTIGYPDDSILLAVNILYEAHKAVGPLGQIPSWERDAQ